MKIIISRTDNIGDVLLTLPFIKILKVHYPDAKIWLLSRNYVKDLVVNLDCIDGLIFWDPNNKELLAEIKNHKFDISILHFYRRDIAKLFYDAGIKKRIGSVRKSGIFFIYLNSLMFTEYKNANHQAQKGLNLLHKLNIDYKKYLNDLPKLNELIEIKKPKLNSKVAKFLTNKFNLILHPCSNGHGRQWPHQYFIDLYNNLDKDKFNIMLHIGPNEEQEVAEIIQACPNINPVIGLSLSELIELIAHSDGLLASGTGSVHLAGALGIKTLGLYPAKNYIGITRWGVLGKQAQSIDIKKNCYQKCSNLDCECMRKIDVSRVEQYINNWLTN